MKATLLTLTNFLFVLNCISQIYFKPTVVGTPNFYSMNNTVVFEAFNVSDKGYFMYDDSNVGGSAQIITVQDTVSNFGIDTLSGIMSSRIDYYSSNGYLSHYQLYSTVVLPKFNYSITSYTEPSSSVSTDGSITISFDSVVPFNTLLFLHRNDTYNDTVVIDANTIRFDSLSSDYLQIAIGNYSDASDYINFRIYIGDPNHIYVNTGMDMNLTVIHADNNCEGMLFTQATNYQGSLYNVWSDGVYNEFNRTSLCPGIYSVYTYDLVNGYYHYGSIDTMIITNNYTAYIDSSIFNYTPQDTAYFNYLNCQFDFNAPIDSINYIEDTLYNSGGVLIVGFEFTIYQGNNFVSLTDSLVLGIDSLITIDVVLYCDQFKSTFQGRRIAYLRGAPTHNFYQPGDLGTSLFSLSRVDLYPNPADDEIHLSFPEDTDGEILIYDSAGKLHLKELTNGVQDLIFNVSDLSSGIYFLKFTSKNAEEATSFTRYFVKQ
jgi:hypothetical protein